ncbi:McrC family protein [Halosquirtibacter laminarini]|uniref:McrC family protein n=1 Tax=Halosquirtibacter laminarini TaxID=3374600 RepID=A0AC61NBD6_9BACT|nr:McrC family protein [Prolixibacteraceae bacterium]
MENNIISCTEHESNVYTTKKRVLSQAEAEGLEKPVYEVLFPKRHRGKDVSASCYKITKQDDDWALETSYFIGVDWVSKKHDCAIQIHPKINRLGREINFLGIVFNAMEFPDAYKEVEELFHIKWDETPIKITQKQDLLTPLMVAEFLSILREIVRKGLKKSYYRVSHNLNGRIKGKVLVGETIKRNILRNRPLYTSCSYEEFGVNGVENRLLKKAFVFAQRYLSNYMNVASYSQLQATIHYITPALMSVSDEVSLHDMKHPTRNKFYKEYERGLSLAHFILRRFGYNIQQAENWSACIRIPPFWIDMSKVFELHVLHQLRKVFGVKVVFQFQTHGLALDFLLNSEAHKMVIDAKYKPYYKDGGISSEDARQVSGYARLNSVYHELNIDDNRLIDCLIIYPDQEDGLENMKEIDLRNNPVSTYRGIYKLGVKLPEI